MFTVTLSDAEVMFCKVAAGLRALTNRAANTKDAKMGGLSGLQMDEDGLLGEYAFCKKMNIFPDLTPAPRSGSSDCILKGKRIDVKTTRHLNGRLLATMKSNEDVDVYVLAIIDETGKTISFPGYATKRDLCAPENQIDLGYGFGYGLKQDKLRVWSEEYCD